MKILLVLAATIVVSASKDCRTSVPGVFCEKNTCLASFKGCYHSKGQNAVLPAASIKNFRGGIDWKKWEKDGTATDMILRCAELAAENNHKYVGIEYYGECYFGNNIDESQGKVTEAEGCEKYCAYDVGGPDSMVVYEVLKPNPPEEVV